MKACMTFPKNPADILIFSRPEAVKCAVFAAYSCCSVNIYKEQHLPPPPHHDVQVPGISSYTVVPQRGSAKRFGEDISTSEKIQDGRF